MKERRHLAIGKVAPLDLPTFAPLRVSCCLALVLLE
jgi:hypothetical protein